MVTDRLAEFAPDLGWKFGGFTRAKKTLGVAIEDYREIRLSGEYVDHNPVESVEQTVLHEVAHAIAGYAAGHGPQWLAVARRIGYTGGRQGEANMPSVAKPLWLAECGEGCEVGYLRKPGVRMVRGGMCNKHMKRITWTNTRTGEELAPWMTY